MRRTLVGRSLNRPTNLYLLENKTVVELETKYDCCVITSLYHSKNVYNTSIEKLVIFHKEDYWITDHVNFHGRNPEEVFSP